MVETMLRLGITGGIGSGKSTVAGYFGRCGAAVIDADAISRLLTASGGLAIDAIRSEFGIDFIAADGALDRNRMRELAYADPSARKRLEAIIHPLVGQKIRQQASVAAQSGHRCVVFDIPLLAESGYWRQEVDKVLVIDCTPEVQIARVTARSGMAGSAVEKIMHAQASREKRLAAADMVIFNVDLSLEQLALEVAQLWRGFGL
ncbi:MAG: hypothetical protein RIS34_1140 [Pseudomonadota bacterium]|jgi:dephospho-CoA kinase